MRIAISAESTIDLSKELLEQYDIHTLPFTVILGGRAGLDGEITSNEIIDYVSRSGILPKTSAVNEYQFEEHFEKLLKDYDAIIHISLSSEISSAYSNAFRASQNYKNVFVIDSRVLSTGIALLAIYASNLAKKGLEPFEIADKVVKRIPNNQTSFVLKRTDYLFKGGRCNALSYLSATLLKIRPQIQIVNGSMHPKKKYVGKMDACIIKYVNDTLETFNTPDLDYVFITYSTATEEQIAAVREILKQRGFKNIYNTSAGATITSHCGENCLGILYQNDGNENGEYIG